ncbi:MAG: hypothetical protein U9M94_01545 [Patescibacteria group bacterium]|nr:hypothetical protein [Patescibacteria group bacterium]
MPNKIDKPKYKITREQAEYIMGENAKHLKLIEDNVYCGKCGGSVTIIDHIFYIDSFSDIILDGKCKVCGGHVVRCTETGENKEAYDKAQEIIKAEQ